MVHTGKGRGELFCCMWAWLLCFSSLLKSSAGEVLGLREIPASCCSKRYSNFIKKNNPHRHHHHHFPVKTCWADDIGPLSFSIGRPWYRKCLQLIEFYMYFNLVLEVADVFCCWCPGGLLFFRLRFCWWDGQPRLLVLLLVVVGRCGSFVCLFVWLAAGVFVVLLFVCLFFLVLFYFFHCRIKTPNVNTRTCPMLDKDFN